MKVSFIIPVYKVEAYLAECVQSILIQTYKDYEILLVDDGSLDNCPKLCDEWARNDERVKAFHKPNGGLSDARNYGLKHATGDYIVFMDGDDFWHHKDDLDKLVQKAKKNPQADFIGYNCDYYYPDTNRYVPWVEYSEELASLANKDATTIALVKSGTFPMSACLKLMKREFLVNNELYFVKGQIAEDIPWFINVLDKSQYCIFINQYVYAYRQNVAGSITNNISQEARQKSFNSLFNIFKTELEKIDSRSFNQEAKNAIKSFLAYEYSILLTYESIPKDSKKELHKYKDILQYTINPKIKIVSSVYRLFGINATEWVLKLYNARRQAKK